MDWRIVSSSATQDDIFAMQSKFYRQLTVNVCRDLPMNGQN